MKLILRFSHVTLESDKDINIPVDISNGKTR
jgi:hypothetical protein